MIEETKHIEETKNRIMEKNLLLSDEFKNFLNSRDIDLINFSNIS